MRRAPVVLFALVAAASLSGCLGVDVGTWWREEGTVHVAIAPLPPAESAIGQFRNLTLTVWSVGLRIAANDADTGRFYLESREFYFDPPLAVELVENATGGATIPLLEADVPLRAVREVVVRLTVNETTLQTGRPIDGCFQGVAHEPPCVRVARAGVYALDELPFTPERGRTATYTVPLGVHFDRDSGEYFVRAEVGRLSR